MEEVDFFLLKLFILIVRVTMEFFVFIIVILFIFNCVFGLKGGKGGVNLNFVWIEKVCFMYGILIGFCFLFLFEI